MNLSGILKPFGGKTKPKSHIKNLIQMAVADGEFCEAEQKLLRDIARRNNMSESEIKEIQQNASKISFELPANDDEKCHQLYDLVNMMVADKKIHAEELKLCDYLAVQFGYSNTRAKDIIQTIRLNIENGNGYDETMKRLKLLL